jgi:ribosomal protein S18 acetylase RimI-like enzyme
VTDIYQIRPAKRRDAKRIFGLIGESADWLQRAKDTNQWAEPWPNRRARNARVRRGIKAGLTWMVEDNGTLVGTITYREHGPDILWGADELRDPAVYVSRLIISREYAGRGIGAALIDWSGQHGIQEWNANWIRVDVWTTNTELHGYYKNQGFTHLRTKEFRKEWDYPSAALFQKPTTNIDWIAAARFKEVSLWRIRCFYLHLIAT